VIRIELLGRFAARRSDGSFYAERWPRALSKRLVRLLALEHPGWVSLQSIYTELWPDHDPAQQTPLRDRLYVLVHTAQRFLQAPDQSPPLLLIERSAELGLRLNSQLISTDLYDLLSRLNAGDLASARRLYRKRLLIEDSDVSERFSQARERLEHALELGLPAAPVAALTAAPVSAATAAVAAAAAPLPPATAKRPATAVRAATPAAAAPSAPATSHPPHPLAGEWPHAVPTAHRVLSPLNETFGRTQDVHRLVSLLRTPSIRWITLVGLGGLGKSRLATVALNQYATDSGVRCVLIDCRLANHTDALLESCIYALTGSLHSDIQDLFEALVSILEARQAVLMLDAFEHVSDPSAAATLTRLLQLAPGLKLLLSSRVAINEVAEYRWNLSPLRLPSESVEASSVGFLNEPAVALYLSHRQHSGRAETLSSKQAQELVALLRSSAGFPLAIEMLARSRRTPPQPATLSGSSNSPEANALIHAALSAEVHLSSAVIEAVSASCARASALANQVFAAFGCSRFAICASMLTVLVKAPIEQVETALIELEDLGLIHITASSDGPLSAPIWYQMLDSVAALAHARFYAQSDALSKERTLLDHLQSLMPEGSVRSPPDTPMAMAWRRYEPHLVYIAQRALLRNEVAAATKLLVCFVPFWQSAIEWRKVITHLSAALSHPTPTTELDHWFLAKTKLLQAERVCFVISLDTFAQRCEAILAEATRLSLPFSSELAFLCVAIAAQTLGQSNRCISTVMEWQRLQITAVSDNRRLQGQVTLAEAYLSDGNSRDYDHIVQQLKKLQTTTTSEFNLFWLPKLESQKLHYSGNQRSAITILINAYTTCKNNGNINFASELLQLAAIVSCLSAETESVKFALDKQREFQANFNAQERWSFVDVIDEVHATLKQDAVCAHNERYSLKSIAELSSQDMHDIIWLAIPLLFYLCFYRKDDPRATALAAESIARLRGRTALSERLLLSECIAVATHHNNPSISAEIFAICEALRKKTNWQLPPLLEPYCKNAQRSLLKLALQVNTESMSLLSFEYIQDKLTQALDQLNVELK
jgi:hypothetical protein